MTRFPDWRAWASGWKASPRLVRILVGLKLITRPDFVETVVEEHPEPDEMDTRTLYVVRSGPWPKWAVFKCPCGCGDVIDISIAQGKNSWSCQSDWIGRPSLRPSVWRHARCYSHFWLTKGMVDWCKDTGKSVK